MPKTSIGIDVDGVLADSFSRWLQEAEKRHGIKAFKKDITRYELSEVFPGVTHEQILEDWRLIWDNYGEIRLEDQDIPSIMDNLGGKFNICITTANPSPNIPKWLGENRIPYDRFIHFKSHSEKHQLDGVSVYVDDFHEVAQSVANSGKTAIILRQPYNDAFIKSNRNPRILAAYGWRDLEDILMTQF